MRSFQANNHIADKRAISLLFEGFLTLIIIGTILLYLPISARSGSLSFIDSLFTATSAVCVTGLTVVNMSYFSLFGQVVVLLLIQLGGLGIMVFSIFFLILVSKKISLPERMIFKDVVPVLTMDNIFRLLRHILLGTILIESLGAGFLYITVFQYQFPLVKAVYYSIFHSVSAFCNSGFSLFDKSFVGYVNNTFLNVIIMFLVIMGGIGFVVFEDIYVNLKHKIMYPRGRVKLRLHTKIVLIFSLVLILFGAVSMFLLESNNSFTGMGIKEKILASFFQSITARTAGFNTIDIHGMSVPSLLVLSFLMFIGGAPGSCAGGIKVTSFGIILFLIINGIQGKPDIIFFKRKLSNEVIVKAISLVFISVFILSIAVVFLSIFEDSGFSFSNSKDAFLEVLFESVSAFGTVGLSTGITAKLTMLGKYVIIALMYIGRLGPLSLGLMFAKEKAKPLYEYPDENIIVG